MAARCKSTFKLWADTPNLLNAGACAVAATEAGSGEASGHGSVRIDADRCGSMWIDVDGSARGVGTRVDRCEPPRTALVRRAAPEVPTFLSKINWPDRRAAVRPGPAGRRPLSG